MPKQLFTRNNTFDIHFCVQSIKIVCVRARSQFAVELHFDFDIVETCSALRIHYCFLQVIQKDDQTKAISNLFEHGKNHVIVLFFLSSQP